jgi:hypothetical protein
VTSYANQLSAALAAELSQRTVLTLGAGVSQGGTALLLSQRPADTGQPALRAPGNPDQLTLTLTEALRWEVSEDLVFYESLVGTLTTPQYALAQYNGSIALSLRLEQYLQGDAVGGGLDANLISLASPDGSGSHYPALVNSLVATWRRDLGPRWTSALQAGVAQVVVLRGSVPLAILPTGNLVASHQGPTSGISLVVTYGPYTDLQTGSITQAGTARFHGFLDLQPVQPKSLAASVGYMRSMPLGPITANASGIGDAFQGDAAFNWGFSDALAAVARLTVAYQFNQPGGIAPSTIFVLTVGVIGRFGNATSLAPMPSWGARVDRSDAVPFSDDPPRKRNEPRALP